jgi:hypothetical protein
VRHLTEATEFPTAFTGRAWLLIALFLFSVAVIFGAYTLAGRTPPTPFQLLAWLGSGLLFAYFVRRDRTRLGARSTLPDLSFLVLVAWPVVVPYHFFSSRGRQGWQPFFVFAAIVVVAYVIEIGFYAAYLKRVYPPLMHG